MCTVPRQRQACLGVFLVAAAVGIADGCSVGDIQGLHRLYIGDREGFEGLYRALYTASIGVKGCGFGDCIDNRGILSQ